MKRIVVMLMSLGLIVGTAAIGSAQPSAAGPKEAVRSGTLAGGNGVIGTGDCQSKLDCQTWLDSDCDPALTGHPVGVFTSIVDVADLAGERKSRVLQYTGVWQGVRIQFWTRGCAEVRTADSSRPYWDARATLRIPRGATWMTVAAGLGFGCKWTLT